MVRIVVSISPKDAQDCDFFRMKWNKGDHLNLLVVSEQFFLQFSGANVCRESCWWCILVEAKGNSQSGFGIILNGMKVPTLICHLGDYGVYSPLIQC